MMQYSGSRTMANQKQNIIRKTGLIKVPFFIFYIQKLLTAYYRPMV